MKIHIEITDEQHKKLRLLKNKEMRSMQYLISKALDNYFKSKRITPWDALPKPKQEALKRKVKALIK